VLLTPERIRQAIDDLHRRNPGKILAAMEIYQAIAQAQQEEDTKEPIAPFTTHEGMLQGEWKEEGK